MAINNRPLPTSPPGTPRRSVFEKINVGKIGSGGYFTKGTWGNRKDMGLKGQLSAVRRAGIAGGETRNLSNKNLRTMYDVLASRLEKHTTRYGVNISGKTKKSMMQEAEKLVRSKGSDFSREDKKDLETVIDSLRKSGRENIRKGREF